MLGVAAFSLGVGLLIGRSCARCPECPPPAAVHQLRELVGRAIMEAEARR
jgi:hypothetical protein